MTNNLLKTEIEVINNKIGIIRIGDVDYISLTDLAKYSNAINPANVIIHWMSNKETFNYINLWEQLNNKNFNFTESREIKINEVKCQTFSLSPKKWIKKTNAIGIFSKGGKYSIGTYAHPDIAFEFASWLSPEFKLYLIKEFERLKKQESYQNNIEWHASRILSKINYLIHTEAISKNIIPTLTEKQKNYVYAEEADILNVALFGITAKEWRTKYPKLAKSGNIRDYTDLLHLIILNNLENINAELIENGVSQQSRLISLNEAAKRQADILIKSKNIKILENLYNKI